MRGCGARPLVGIDLAAHQVEAQQVAVQRDVDAHAGSNARQRAYRPGLFRPQRRRDVGGAFYGSQFECIAIGGQTPIRAIRTEMRVQDRSFVLVLCHCGIPLPS
ncbi:hypothetical protein D9M68_576620 [compost metagenome]